MDTITLENALAGFTSNESSALSAYIGTNGKQSAAALAKVVGEHGFTAIAAGATSTNLFGGLYAIGHSYNGFGIISISQANGVEDFMNKLSPNQMVAQQVSGTSQYTITNNSSGVRYYKLLARLE